ncbi:MAG: gliding motility-associated C-terminal domain-containing protein [Bacteroidales bacterium]|nr:gliding motility-associated C-terminal domain-containing protein [Bacteroidales bacterium]
MKIEELFAKELEDYTMDVSDKAWGKIESKLSSSSGSVHTQAAGAAKSLSVAAKTVITVLSVAAVSAAGYLVYDNIKPQEQPTAALTVKNETVLQENSAKAEVITLEDIQQNVKPQQSTDKAKDIVFEITDENGIMIKEPDIQPDLKPMAVQNNAPTSLGMPQTKENSADEPSSSGEQPQQQAEQHSEDSGVHIGLPNLITPNGDGINDCLVFSNIENYQDNVLKVFDRQQRVIYHKDNYNNEFCGQNLPNGVYFYRLAVRHNGKTTVYTRSLDVRR